MIWQISIKDGFRTLNRNRKLIIIALISVVFGKIIDLIEQFTDKTLYELIAVSVRTEKLQHALESAKTGRFDETLRVLNQMEYLNLEQPQFLIIVASLLIAAFLIAFYNDTGLAALIRDLLIKNSYRSTQVIAYGRMYFKPALIFKGSFYLIAGFVVVVISPILFFVYQMLASPILAWTVIALCTLPLLVIYVSFLSLGMKFIIIEGEQRVRAIYRLTKSLMLDNRWEVGICFFFMVLVTVGSTIAAYYLMGSQLQFLISYSLSIFMLSYVTVLLKITSFVFYLLIRDRQTLPINDTEVANNG